MGGAIGGYCYFGPEQRDGDESEDDDGRPTSGRQAKNPKPVNGKCPDGYEIFTHKGETLCRDVSDEDDEEETPTTTSTATPSATPTPSADSLEKQWRDS